MIELYAGFSRKVGMLSARKFSLWLRQQHPDLEIPHWTAFDCPIGDYMRAELCVPPMLRSTLLFGIAEQIRVELQLPAFENQNPVPFQTYGELVRHIDFVTR